ncbi:MAG: ABC transporter ATP-binding protein [Clostridiales bacterium]|jgi:putative ABC transport system ATP-binding protein|nr:ABC transporter ATP-binding protein [Clostridiales bacterium]
MVEIRNLSKKYGDFFALNDISMTVEQGDYTAVMGRSGSGKSTLLHIIGGLDKATVGQILFEGEDIAAFSEKRAARYRNQKIGFVFQAFHLEPSYSVYKNMEIPLLIAGTEKEERRERIKKYADKLGISEKLNSVSRTLSGGEKQRAAIARALITEPKLILADEPCGNLDSVNAGTIMDIFDMLNSEGKTILLVTHQEGDAKRARKRIVLHDGAVMNE